MTDGDISSSQDQSLHICNKFLQPEKVEKEIKKKKKFKRPDKEDSVQTINIQTSQLQSEFLHSDINTKSEKVNLCSAATNEAHTPGDECVVFRKEKKYKKPRSETADHKLCEGMENMKEEHQNLPSLGTGAKTRKKKWKGIPSKVTSTEETQMVDITHEEYFASYSKKKKKKYEKEKERKTLEV